MAMEGHCENNSVNRMQEHLQAICPVSGCPPWRYDERGDTDRWKVRIVLEQCGPRGDQDTPMPWSPPCGKKKDAKKAAARLCLESLIASGDRPHDPAHVRPLAVGLAHRAAAAGAGAARAGAAGAAGGAAAAPAVLPTLDAALLGAAAVECTARAAGQSSGWRQGVAAEPQPEAAAGGGSDSDAEDPVTSMGDSDEAGGAAGPPGGHVPPNLGQLGEEYAVGWFRHRGFTVRWLNGEGEQQQDHDLETWAGSSSTSSSSSNTTAPRLVEVKTRWRGSKAAMSRRQRARLLDPADDYVLLIIGEARRLFEAPASQPYVRIFTPASRPHAVRQAAVDSRRRRKSPHGPAARAARETATRAARLEAKNAREEAHERLAELHRQEDEANAAADAVADDEVEAEKQRLREELQRVIEGQQRVAKERLVRDQARVQARVQARAELAAQHAADPNDFEPLEIDPGASDEEKQAALFRWVDCDGDGVLSRAEYGRFLMLLGKRGLADEEWTRQCADLYKADPAVGITGPQYAASYGRKGKMTLKEEIEVVRRQLALLAAGSIDLRSRWTRYIHNNREIYQNGETKALSRVAPAAGVRREHALENAEEFEAAFENARKYDAGELNAESKWTRNTNGDRAYYWNRETKARSLVAPAEGVKMENLKTDKTQFDKNAEQARKYDHEVMQAAVMAGGAETAGEAWLRTVRELPEGSWMS